MNPTTLLTVALASMALCSTTSASLARQERGQEKSTQQQDPKPDPKQDPKQDPKPKPEVGQAQRTPFDDTKWIVELVPDVEAKRNGEKPLVDTLVVTGGKLYSKHGQVQGFRPAPAIATQNTLTAESHTSDQRNKCEWRADLSGDELVGSLTSTRVEGTIVRYALNGKRATVLEGTRWAISVKAPPPDGTEKDKAEAEKAGTAKPAQALEGTLTFQDNRLTSDLAPVKGVVPASYRLVRIGDRMTVTADAQDEKQGRIAWILDFDKEVMRGTLRVAGTEGSFVTHTLEGKRQPDVDEASLPKLPSGSGESGKR